MLPTVNRSAVLARRLALLLVVASAAGALGWLWWSAIQRSDIAFLPRRSPAEWVIYPAPPEAILHPRTELSTTFKRAFVLEKSPARAELRVAGFHRYELRLNGAVAKSPARADLNWKQPDSYEVSERLRVGENEIAVTVFNTNGPPALWLCLAGPGLELRSDESWQASCVGATWQAARLASQPKVAKAGNPVCGGEEPWASLPARWPALLLFVALATAGYWFVSRHLPTTHHASRITHHPAPAAPGIFSRELLLVLALALLWVVLFANNLGVLPALVGYDVDGHTAYIRYLHEHHSLPRADEGWEMFQPPLYYLLSAGLLGVLSLSVTQDSGVMALRMMGLVIGVAHFLLVWASLRLLFPGERSKASWGLALAAALPPLLFLSQYVSNEGLGAALVSACVCLTLRLLKQERVSWKACAGLGLCLGAALLTKPTALLAVPVVVGALACKTVQGLMSNIQSRGTGKAGQASAVWQGVGRLGLILVVCAVVCGWHYARLWVNFGNPLIGVWDPRLGFSWWQDDGYRTSAFYLRFGAVLAHPWFSSFKSFGDGFYGTLWGDGLFGGMANALARPPWNYDLMAVGYWLALWPTLAAGVGGILMLVKFLRRPTAEWLLVLGLAFLATLAMVQLSIALPYQCHVKAFYGLCALVPLCAFGACGLDALSRWSGKLRPAVCILFGVWAINSYAAFWIARSAEASFLSRAQSLWKEGRRAEAVDLLKIGLERNPDHSAKMTPFLAYLLMETGALPEAGKLAETAVRQQPNDPSGHLVLAALWTRQQRYEEAIEHGRQAVQLAPNNDSGYEQLASLLCSREQYDEAIRTAREGLGVVPFSADLRFALGTALIFRGEINEGIAQLQLACELKAKWGGPHVLLGATLTKLGRFEEATKHLQQAVRLEPTNATAHCQLAVVLNAQQQVDEAIAHYTEALRSAPDLAEALNNLAWIRAANTRADLRDGAEAVRLAERACRVTDYKEPMLVGTLAASYAEAGRFEEAVTAARQARDLALANGQKDLAQKNQQLIELFGARQPYREPTQP